MKCYFLFSYLWCVNPAVNLISGTYHKRRGGSSIPVLLKNYSRLTTLGSDYTLPLQFSLYLLSRALGRKALQAVYWKKCKGLQEERHRDYCWLSGCHDFTYSSSLSWPMATTRYQPWTWPSYLQSVAWGQPLSLLLATCLYSLKLTTSTMLILKSSSSLL